jgi:hypothetical protein
VEKKTMISSQSAQALEDEGREVPEVVMAGTSFHCLCGLG